uniref:Cytochrome P450 n=1 Tax=Clastoptera arizonana TaxID=38151 RepID=A0A1B6CZQ5_9HEMI
MEASLSVTSVLCAIIIALCSLLYYYFTSTFNYWKYRGVKFIKPLPFIGNMENFFTQKKHGAEWFSENYKLYEKEKFYGMYFFRKPFLVVQDPDLVHSVLVSDFSHFIDRGFVKYSEVDKLSGHLLSLTGDLWKNLRKKLTPIFTSGKLKGMIDELQVCVDELDNVLSGQAGQEVQVEPLMERFTTRVIGSVAFGCEFDTLTDPNSEFSKRADSLFKVNFRTAFTFLLDNINPNVRNFLGIKVLPKETEDFYLNFVKDTVSHREKNNITRNDFLQLLINLRKEDAAGAPGSLEGSHQKIKDRDNVILDDSLMASNVYIFFVAGFETTATTLSNLLLELAANQEVQDKLREEVRKALGTEGKLSYDVINEMAYMKMVISEVLRKYPPAANVSRECTKAYTIPGSDVTIEESILVTIPAYAIHMDPKYFPDPEKFLPERFTDNNKNIKQGTYMPFGDGPRNCIGMRFAMLEMKMVVASLLSKYHFTLPPTMKYPIVFDKKAVFLKAEGGIRLKVEKL